MRELLSDTDHSCSSHSTTNRDSYSYLFLLDSYHYRRPNMYKKRALVPFISSINKLLSVSARGKCGKIVLYQTLDAFTGGTTAMRILYRSLLALGYRQFAIDEGGNVSCVPSVLLCNNSVLLLPPQSDSYRACTSPSGE